MTAHLLSGIFLAVCIAYILYSMFWPWGRSKKVNDDFTINGYSRGFTWREEWARGKQVTFMEPEPVPISEEDQKAITRRARLQAQADPSAYWLGPRDKVTNTRGLYVPWRD